MNSSKRENKQGRPSVSPKNQHKPFAQFDQIGSADRNPFQLSREADLDATAFGNWLTHTTLRGQVPDLRHQPNRYNMPGSYPGTIHEHYMTTEKRNDSGLSWPTSVADYLKDRPATPNPFTQAFVNSAQTSLALNGANSAMSPSNGLSSRPPHFNMPGSYPESPTSEQTTTKKKLGPFSQSWGNPAPHYLRSRPATPNPFAQGLVDSDQTGLTLNGANSARYPTAGLSTRFACLDMPGGYPESPKREQPMINKELSPFTTNKELSPFGQSWSAFGHNSSGQPVIPCNTGLSSFAHDFITKKGGASESSNTSSFTASSGPTSVSVPSTRPTFGGASQTEQKSALRHGTPNSALRAAAGPSSTQPSSFGSESKGNGSPFGYVAPAVSSDGHNLTTHAPRGSVGNTKHVGFPFIHKDLTGTGGWRSTGPNTEANRPAVYEPRLGNVFKSCTD